MKLCQRKALNRQKIILIEQYFAFNFILALENLLLSRWSWSSDIKDFSIDPVIVICNSFVNGITVSINNGGESKRLFLPAKFAENLCNNSVIREMVFQVVVRSIVNLAWDMDWSGCSINGSGFSWSDFQVDASKNQNSN